MERQTFERALHSWEDWHKSIERSRETLGYDPLWKKETCIKWIENNYPAIKNQAKNELKKMDLPPTLQRYWEDCFYSNYRTKDGKTDYSKITRCLSDHKTNPELPCDQRILWNDGENIHDPWLRVEIWVHTRFVTKELFNYAARYAYETVQSHRRWNEIKDHPVCKWLKGGRPSIDDDVAIECARLKDEEGLRYKEIGLKHEWALQIDSYGKLNQCNTAKRYVKRGRELRKKYEQ